ncbi:hypothetical protein EYF80_049254 [Liparis tanakae]|uniref:Uncharacterized protein n=1 Tax=Liparis tanakae TaxID=230148 RepID=A0A4Z2FIH3_9TELE|nr:hypothetical protein EYF80_049254 [Liparis tanakae]
MAEKQPLEEKKELEESENKEEEGLLALQDDSDAENEPEHVSEGEKLAAVYDREPGHRVSVGSKHKRPGRRLTSRNTEYYQSGRCQRIKHRLNHLDSGRQSAGSMQEALGCGQRCGRKTLLRSRRFHENGSLSTDREERLNTK